MMPISAGPSPRNKSGRRVALVGEELAPLDVYRSGNRANLELFRVPRVDKGALLHMFSEICSGTLRPNNRFQTAPG